MSLDLVRALVLARQLADEALDQAVRECIQSGVDRSMLAHELGLNRSTLYRRYVWSRGGQERPQAGAADS